jgi:hypothetical protein
VNTTALVASAPHLPQPIRSAGGYPIAVPRIVVRLATIADVYALARRLRPGDRAEALATGMDPRRALRFCFRHSLYPPQVCVVDGEIAAMWGLYGEILSDVGHPWLMTGTAVERIPVTLLKIGRRTVEEMLSHKPRLANFVLASYADAIAFLQRLGFRLDEPRPLRPGGAPFRRFHITDDQWDAFQRQDQVLRSGARFAPFIVYTSGRSRTAWLSQFLTYGHCRCHNEIAIKLRSMEDVRALYDIPGTGSAETGAAPAWQLIQHYVPGIRSVVVRRPLEDIVASFARSEVAHIASIDEPRLRRIIAYENRCLEKISAQPGVLTVDFADLHKRDVCAAIFEHCLPYRFDEGWWLSLKDRNIQSNVTDIFRYYRDNRDGVEGFKRTAKRQLTALARAGTLRAGGLACPA